MKIVLYNENSLTKLLNTIHTSTKSITKKYTSEELKNIKNLDFYFLLGIENYRDKEIPRNVLDFCYRKSIMRYHPDKKIKRCDYDNSFNNERFTDEKFTDENFGREIFLAIRKAHDVLKDVFLKKKYDQYFMEDLKFNDLKREVDEFKIYRDEIVRKIIENRDDDNDEEKDEYNNDIYMDEYNKDGEKNENNKYKNNNDDKYKNNQIDEKIINLIKNSPEYKKILFEFFEIFGKRFKSLYKFSVKSPIFLESDKINDFYTFWRKFESKRNFDFYDLIDGNEVNLNVQKKIKNDYLNEVRDLVEICRKCDPRIDENLFKRNHKDSNGWTDDDIQKLKKYGKMYSKNKKINVFMVSKKLNKDLKDVMEKIKELKL
ncbi:Zuotin [Dictyocoela muelleri]|nr:Zuotin [Dictyocoela muelleri]